MNRQSFQLKFLGAIIGNICEHYDKYLFNFIAPFIAPLFFHNTSPLTAIILTYAMTPLGFLSRPLGAFVFGKMGDRFGRKHVLVWSLVGMALTTFLIGCLPTYGKVGLLAPLSLALLRMIQNFFASGEGTGGALLILENCSPKKRSLYSSIFDCSSVLGILVAAFAVTLLNHLEIIQIGWRFLYWAGALTGLIGLLVRRFIVEPKEENSMEPVPTRKVLWNYRSLLLSIFFVTGFSNALYESATTLLNNYLPLVSKLSTSQSVKMNTWILVLDFFLLPLFGLLAMKRSKKEVMGTFALLIIVCAFPIFSFLLRANSLHIISSWILLVILAVGFSAPIYAWLHEVTPKEYRFTLMSVGIALSHQVFGGLTTPLNLWIYQVSGWKHSPALYLACLGIMASLSLRKTKTAQPTELRPI